MKYELYKDGILIEARDTRKVSVVASNRISEIKEACRQAIEDTGIGWMVEREISGGSPVPQAIKDQCAAYRSMSNLLEAQINQAVSQAVNDDDKAACDLIEAVLWK